MQTKTSNRKILAVGASGKFAGLVIPELVKRGSAVRGLARNEEDAGKAQELGAAEVALGDLTNAASIRAALEGIDSVFYIAPAFMQHEVNAGKAFVNAAKAAGVQRIVFSSVIHPEISDLSNHSEAAR